MLRRVYNCSLKNISNIKFAYTFNLYTLKQNQLCIIIHILVVSNSPPFWTHLLQGYHFNDTGNQVKVCISINALNVAFYLTTHVFHFHVIHCTKEPVVLYEGQWSSIISIEICSNGTLGHTDYLLFFIKYTCSLKVIGITIQEIHLKGKVTLDFSFKYCTRVNTNIVMASLFIIILLKLYV